MAIAWGVKVSVAKERTHVGEGAHGIDIIPLGQGGCQGAARVETAGRTVTSTGGGDRLVTVLEGARHYAREAEPGTHRNLARAVREVHLSTGFTVGLKSQAPRPVEMRINETLLGHSDRAQADANGAWLSTSQEQWGR